MNEYVTFRLDGQAYATRIASVREVVRLAQLAVLPGLTPPIAGVLDLRGVSLPVVDIRASGGPGDVLVLSSEDADYGFACDEVLAVVGEDTLVEETSRAAASGTLPPYVETVLRGPDGPVFLVDVDRMAGADA